MTLDSRKTFFVSRRSKIFGPFTADQMLKGKAANKFLESDLISENIAGPWISLSQHFSEFIAQPVKTVALPAILDSSESGASPKMVHVDIVGQNNRKPSSIWKYVVIGILGVFGAGFVGLVGLAVIFLAVGLLLSSGEPEAESSVAAIDERSEIAVPNSSNVQGENSSGESVGSDAGSGVDFSKSIADLQAAMERLKAAPSNSQGEVTSSQATAIVDGELSAEQMALSPEDAFILGVSFLEESQRATHGRTGVQLLQKAAEAGHGLAMFNLFAIYMAGYCVEVDNATGLSWLRRSAEAGDPKGMHAYSVLIREGHFEGMGESEGLMWLSRSAQVGYQPAIDELNGKKSEAIARSFDLLLDSVFSQQATSGETRACNGTVGFLSESPCSCEKFNLSALSGYDTCYSCGHPKDYHNR